MSVHTKGIAALLSELQTAIAEVEVNTKKFEDTNKRLEEARGILEAVTNVDGNWTKQQQDTVAKTKTIIADEIASLKEVVDTCKIHEARLYRIAAEIAWWTGME